MAGARPVAAPRPSPGDDHAAWTCGRYPTVSCTCSATAAPGEHCPMTSRPGAPSGGVSAPGGKTAPWERVHEALRPLVRQRTDHDSTPSAAIIASQPVKTTEWGGWGAPGARPAVEQRLRSGPGQRGSVDLPGDDPTDAPAATTDMTTLFTQPPSQRKTSACTPDCMHFGCYAVVGQSRRQRRARPTGVLSGGLRDTETAAWRKS